MSKQIKYSFNLIFLFLIVFSLYFSNDNTAAYFVLVVLFLFAQLLLYRENVKSSFILNSFILIIYTYSIGIYFKYATQDLFTNIVSENRIMGYSALGSLVLIFLSALSLLFLYKAYKTKKTMWYLGFLVLTLLSYLGFREGYGSNYFFKLAVLLLNCLIFKRSKQLETVS